MNGLGKFKRYRIGEAAKALGVKTSVLRFWEGAFGQLEPVRTASGQRLYTEEHLALLRRIKGLLYDEGLTIEGAKKRLEEGDGADAGASCGVLDVSGAEQEPGISKAAPDARDRALLHEVAEELRDILSLLAPGGRD